MTQKAGNQTTEQPDPKYIAQIKLILEAFGRDAGVHPPEWEKEGADYLYRIGTVLVRDEDLPRVVELFQGGTTG